ncbi:hypothetical protein NOR_07123 [Metarhizium rileyi]|uniref:Uncharacterized protein n=1 Tax=Metarhizium rileyi (strain RCEF 4871) TaxID=1649241 RepID=A0A166Z0V9_METRR|nr:hypothetical protein NOR_07123 [Metarhizium rileyi RCEF 4871]
MSRESRTRGNLEPTNQPVRREEKLALVGNLADDFRDSGGAKSAIPPPFFLPGSLGFTWHRSIVKLLQPNEETEAAEAKAEAKAEEESGLSSCQEAGA